MRGGCLLASLFPTQPIAGSHANAHTPSLEAHVRAGQRNLTQRWRGGRPRAGSEWASVHQELPSNPPTQLPHARQSRNHSSEHSPGPSGPQRPVGGCRLADWATRTQEQAFPRVNPPGCLYSQVCRPLLSPSQAQAAASHLGASLSLAGLCAFVPADPATCQPVSSVPSASTGLGLRDD